MEKKSHLLTKVWIETWEAILPGSLITSHLLTKVWIETRKSKKIKRQRRSPSYEGVD